jgi:hypothetical protein
VQNVDILWTLLFPSLVQLLAQRAVDCGMRYLRLRDAITRFVAPELQLRISSTASTGAHYVKQVESAPHSHFVRRDQFRLLGTSTLSVTVPILTDTVQYLKSIFGDELEAL